MDEKTGLNFDVEHLKEIEQYVLGNILIGTGKESNYEIYELIQKHNLIPEDFYFIRHQEIFKAILECFKNNISVDILTVSQFRPQQYKENNVFSNTYKDWDFYNVGLTQKLSSNVHFEYHLMMLKEYNIALLWNKIAHTILSPNWNWNLKDKIEVSENILKRYHQLYDRYFTPLINTENSEVDDYEKELTKKVLAYNNDSENIGVKTGIQQIDSFFDDYLYGSELYIIAGRPGMGKTTDALIIAWNACKNYGVEIDFYSIEMPRSQLINKIISSETGIDYHDIKKGNINMDDLAIISQWNKKIKSMGFNIITNLKNIYQVSDHYRKKSNKKRLGVLDYIQRLDPTNKNDYRLSVTTITRELKSMAKDTDTPVIALSQLLRSVDSRQNKRPTLSDLKESGSIEEDADVIIFPYCQAYYDKSSGMPVPENDRWKTELIMGKGRDGVKDTIVLNINASNLKVTDYNLF